MGGTSTEAPPIPDGMALVPVGELAAFGLAMERAEATIRGLEAELADVRGHVRTLAEVEASATAAERDRIRAGAEALKVTLSRPGNGPAQTQALDVVPLEGLLGVLDGGDPA